MSQFGAFGATYNRTYKFFGAQMCKWSFLFSFVLFIGLNSSHSAEQRCLDLGANCVCSEPLQATSYSTYVPVPNVWWNPNDSTIKECDGELTGTATGYAVVRLGSFDLVPSQDATMLAALPPGHSVARVLAGPEGHVGPWFTGHNFTNSSSVAKRVAVRFYIYYSPNMAFDDDPSSCNANKLFQFSGHPTNNAGFLLDNGYGPTSLYNFLALEGGTGAQDCCGFGQLQNGVPSTVLDKMSLSGSYTYYRGKWLRYEVIMTNRDSYLTGEPVTVKVYVKNISDNTPEYLIVDSCDTDGGLLAPCGHIPIFSMNTFLINSFRQDTCPGWLALSHLLVAGWDTDQGQRIGAALEVEGDSGVPEDTTAPAPPSALVLQ